MPGKQKLVYVDSYHPGEASSDAILAGIYEVVADSKARLDVFFLDTNRYPQAESISARVEEVRAALCNIRPEVVLVSGENAVEAVLAAHLKDGPIPSVFCGLDWTCTPYGLPTEHVTGILEIPPVAETIATLRPYYPDMKRVAVLGGKTALERCHQGTLDTVFSECRLAPTYASAETYEEWKLQFARVAVEVDVVVLLTNQRIAGWDEADAEAFVGEYARVPVVTCDVAMVKYAMFGVVAAGREQGQWAAQTALRILRGKNPARIPVAQSQQTQAYINVTLAEKIGFEPDEELLNRCRRVE